MKRSEKRIAALLACALLFGACTKKPAESDVPEDATDPKSETETTVETEENENAEARKEEAKTSAPAPVKQLVEAVEPSREFFTVQALDGGYFAVMIDDFSLGILDGDGNEVLPCQYNTKLAIASGVLPLRGAEGWGYYNLETRRFIADCVYESVTVFSEGLGCVCDGETYTFVDTEGKNPFDGVRFFEAAPFSDGLARVLTDSAVGYIDKTGAVKVWCDYEAFDDFHEGLARVADDGVFGYMGKDGKLAIDCSGCERIYNFKDGRAVVVKDGLLGVIDTDGKLVIPFAETAPHRNLADDYFKFCDGVLPFLRNGKYGFLDSEGSVVIEPEYDMVLFAKEGAVRVKKDGKYGFVAVDGTKITDCVYDSASSFCGGCARVEIEGQYGFIDKNGTYLIAPTLEDATDLSGDAAAVRKGGLWGFVKAERGEG